jgi:hypothetical protein
MANNLYPLTYKPGIKRDGSIFQSDYCTSGQWVRFQRGCVRKMGGMLGIIYGPAFDLDTSAIYVLPSTDSIFQIYSFVRGAGNTIIIENTTFNQNLQILTRKNLTPDIRLTRAIVQTELVVQNNKQYLVCLFADRNAENITNNGPSVIYYSDISTDGVFVPLLGIAKLFPSSGLLFASNYLFVYGYNGSVAWSKPNNPLDFTDFINRQITISNDKVICGKSIRGGINNPAILFWTLSSVVRCINNPGPNTSPDTLAFQIDVISKDSSILSSRCVVEYDGRFFWPGVNRFFQYNGLVQELPNTMSLNYFFNNIDMTLRQNVFGVKNAQYGEIWWFYPEKLKTPGRLDLPYGSNTKALIYNIREDSWYDTAISRVHGVHSDTLGIMFTYGRPLTIPNSPSVYLYKHEDTTLSSDFEQNEVAYTVADRTIYYNNPIVSNFTTPVISWAAFNAMKQFTGINRWVYLIAIEPDFILMPPQNLGIGDMTVTINTRQYALDFPLPSAAYPIPGALSEGQDSILAKVDVAWQGRYISLTFTTTRNFEMGQVILQLGIGDGQ